MQRNKNIYTTTNVELGSRPMKAKTYGVFFRKSHLFYLAFPFLFYACSTTKKIGNSQVLYTGVKKIKVETAAGEKLSGDESSAIVNPMKYPPNNPLYSPYVRTPIPTGLWVYNWNMEDPGWFKKWLYNRLAKKPVLLSDVKPELRTQVVENAARDYGHFGAKATCDTIYNKRNPLKAKVSYHVYLPEAYRLGKVEMWGWKGELDTLVRRSFGQSLMKSGEKYNINNMEQERERISSVLRNRGYYYFAPDYIEFLADSTHQDGKIIDVRTTLKQGVVPMALQPYKIRNVELVLGDPGNAEKQDSVVYNQLTISHYAPSRLRKRVARQAITFNPGDLYTLRKQERIQSNLSRLGVFSYTNITLSPVDTSRMNPYGLLDVKIHAEYDLPVETEIEVDVSSKSNSLLGPGLQLSVVHKNIFHGGENLSLRLKGAYEWQTQGRKQNVSGVINSYELGLNVGLSVSRLLIPRQWRGDRYFSEQTNFQLNADLMSRNTFFRMLSFSGSITYDFQTALRKYHSITPFKLNYTYLLKTSQQFEDQMKDKPWLKLSFQNQFVLSASYTYTYDRKSRRISSNRFFWQATLTSAGNLLSGIQYLSGNHQGEGKKIFNNVYAQFLKLNSQIIVYRRVNASSYLAMRLLGAVGYAYGNLKVMPYSEQFYIGGAYSIRAFAVRSVGPGHYYLKNKDEKLPYLDQTGDLKLEGNVEYRFKMSGQLSGALFLDAGNIWLLRKDEDRPGGQFEMKKLGENIALGTGFGLRYDLSYLVIRADVGIGLHLPYSEKKGYFNVARKDLFSFHLAIGYPF